MKSNFEGYNNFIQLLCQLQDSSENDFIISLENTEVFEANLAAILGAITDSGLELQKKVELVEIRRAIKTVIVKISILVVK